MAFEENLYCDYTPGAAKAVAGKDVILAVFNAAGINYWLLRANKV